ncbi:MAG: hypothetical protein H7096_07765 [Flavobacterium sp.]|nr:hypothetical protein [Pedobacter sp.]
MIIKRLGENLFGEEYEVASVESPVEGIKIGGLNGIDWNEADNLVPDNSPLIPDC